MRILVVGAGATGGYFGAQVALAGRDVTFLVRPKRADLLRERGLRIVGLGREQILQPRLVTAPELAQPYDLILFSVKATGLDHALEDVAPAVGPSSVIVPFLNGMAHMDALNRRFGAERVFGGVVMLATTVNAEGDIVRFTPLSSMAVGEQDGSATDRLAAVVATMSGAGFEVSASSDILAAMWHKWAFISTVGAMTTLGRGTVGEITAVPGGAQLGPAVLAEAAAVSGAAGFPLPRTTLDSTAATVTKQGSDFCSSMSRDAMNGLPTEVEHILGDFTARARALGVATPLLDLATLQLRVHERRLSSAVR
ncbi:MAG TPA: ketopantoate reductase family protein [Actinocrinis sp.]|nr:ketopantoate reductase family protein [Actinocrinis sp.]